MKVKSVKFSSHKETVYDFETPSHTYILGNGIISHNTQELYSKAIVSGGTGIYYSSDTIFILGRQQEKDADGIAGYNFVINVEKSRYTREKSKIAIQVLHEGGINKWSGLLDMALASGHVIKPKNGWYAKVNKETGEISEKSYREAQTNTSDFWTDILKTPSFIKYVEETYKVANGAIMGDDEIDNAMQLGEDDETV